MALSAQEKLRVFMLLELFSPGAANNSAGIQVHDGFGRVIALTHSQIAELTAFLSNDPAIGGTGGGSGNAFLDTVPSALETEIRDITTKFAALGHSAVSVEAPDGTKFDTESQRAELRRDLLSIVPVMSFAERIVKWNKGWAGAGNQARVMC